MSGRATVLCVGLLAGCAEPISNQVFYEEAEYLDALPTSARFHAPAEFLDLDPSDPVLRAATKSAGDLRGLYQPMTLCGEALVDTEPDVRGDTFRTWDVVPVVVVTDQGSFDWWVRGTVTALDAAAWTWTIEGARNRIGPWHALASGRHEASGVGYVSWRLDLLGALLGVSILGELEHVYARQGDGVWGVETRMFTDPLATDPVAYWGAQGDSGFSWTGMLEVTDDGASWPGVAVAVQTPGGGRADGVVWAGAEGTQVTFGNCWNGTGATTWSGGDEAAFSGGDPTSCVTGSLLDSP